MDNKEIIQELVTSLGKQKHDFLNQVESSVRDYISSQGKKCLTINQLNKDGSIRYRWELSADIDYAKCLAAFCQRKPFRGCELDSGLTEPVVELVSSKFATFYQKNEQALNQAALKSLLKNKVIIGSIVDKIVEKALTNKGTKQIAGHVTSAVTTKIVSLIVAEIHDIVHSQAGEATIHTIQHAVASGVAVPLVKTIALVIVKLISLHMGALVVKLLASTAFKIVVATAVKKFLAVVLLAFIIKMIAVKLGIAVGTAYFIILLPLIAAFIYYEIRTFPSQLGEKVSEKVRQELDQNFDKTNHDIIEHMFKQLLGEVENIATNIAKSSEVQGYIDELVSEMTKQF